MNRSKFRKAKKKDRGSIRVVNDAPFLIVSGNRKTLNKYNLTLSQKIRIACLICQGEM